MIIDAPPAAVRISSHTDIMFTAVCLFIASSTVARLSNKPGLGTDYVPFVSLSSILLKNQLEMVIPSGCCSVALVV